MTAGVSALPDDVRARAIELTRTFDDFTSDNDPHKEHDFGSFTLGGRKLFSNMTTTTSRWSSARTIRPTRQRRRACSPSCSRTNTEDAVFLWGSGRQSVRISRRTRSRLPLRRSPHHRRAARGSCAISRVLARRPEGRQEGDLHRRIQGVRSHRVSRGSSERLEIIRRSDIAKGFEVLPRRSVLHISAPSIQSRIISSQILKVTIYCG